MGTDFEKYRHENSEEDIKYAENGNVFCRRIFKSRNKIIVIFPEYPKAENHLAIIFINGSKEDKYLFDLTDVKYNEYLFELLLKYNFGLSELKQIENYNNIQEVVICHYSNENENRTCYQEMHKTSIIYALVHNCFSVSSKPIRTSIIDTKALVGGVGSRIQRFNKKDMFELGSINYIYLMHDKKEDLYKIGFSKVPEFREKTLLSQKPNISIYRQWVASQKYESILKNNFKNKRGRGEWFKLSQEDITSIDTTMKKFSKNPSEALIKMMAQLINNWSKK